MSLMILICLIMIILLYILTFLQRPKWEENTIHAARELAGNPSDTRRTRSQFESALCMKDPLFAEKCYLIVESDTHTY